MNEKSKWIRRGRPAAVRFPVRRTLVASGVDYEIEIPRWTKVRCLRCGNTLDLCEATVSHLPHEIDDMEYVRCPWCTRLAAIVDYYDQLPDGGKAPCFATPA